MPSIFSINSRWCCSSHPKSGFFCFKMKQEECGPCFWMKQTYKRYSLHMDKNSMSRKDFQKYFWIEAVYKKILWVLPHKNSMAIKKFPAQYSMFRRKEYHRVRTMLVAWLLTEIQWSRRFSIENYCKLWTVRRVRLFFPSVKLYLQLCSIHCIRMSYFLYSELSVLLHFYMHLLLHLHRDCIASFELSAVSGKYARLNLYHK